MGKANLNPDFKELFAALDQAKVKYLLIGGYAVTYYGYHRYTKDIDIWIATEPENAQKVSAVLSSWGGFPAARVPPSMFTKDDMVYVMGRTPTRIDILTGPPGVNFDDCWLRRKLVNLDGVNVPLIALDDLIKNKIASGRLKDLADVENLTAKRKAKPKPKPPKRRKK